MAIFRKIHVSFWSDAFISDLTDKQKLFYLYLLTNERTTQLGVYEITKKQIAYDLGYTIDVVSKLISEIEKTGRIKFNGHTSEIGIKNWNRYNLNTSSKVVTLVNKEKERIKDKSLIDFIYSIDTVSILYPQEEEEKEQELKESLEEPKEINFDPFDENFRIDWLKWINYKKDEFKQSYKKIETEQTAFDNLLKLSKNDIHTAREIINQSIANQWKGLFTLKTDNNGTTTTTNKGFAQKSDAERRKEVGTNFDHL